MTIRNERQTVEASFDYGKVHPVSGAALQPHLQPRFTELATFMRAPVSEGLSELDIGLIGVPTDLGVTNRPGARHGPREIRNASSLMRSYNIECNVSPFKLCRVADLGDVPFTSLYELPVQVADIERHFRAIGRSGVRPLSAGGDHSITYPILKGLAPKEPYALVQVDAHTDTWDEMWGSKYHHGAPFRLAVEDGLIDPKRTIQIGIRGGQNGSNGIDFCRAHGMRVVFMEEFADSGVDQIIKETRSLVGSRPTYFTFDVDGLDPAFAPGTGTPEVGGISTVEALRLIRGLRGLNIIGGDVVEVAPPFDQTGNTALVGATLMFEILCLMAQAVADSRQ